VSEPPFAFLGASTGAGVVTALVSFLAGGAGGALTFLRGSGFWVLLAGGALTAELF
jgi:hypothetical protein